MIENVIELPFDVPLLPVKSLNAGEISCLYENGNLRKISFRGKEIIKMIYPAVRNTNWQTAISEITDEKINSYDKGFEISYTAIFRLNQIHYKSGITITGKEDDSIFFAMHGEALSNFEKRRIGLCVLHPISACRGKRVTITRPDQSTYTAVFPDYVSPHQPFFEVQQMLWINNQDHTIKMIFEGDVFETEDQRNWTDNSYKTYSTPLDRPSPVLIEKGTTMEQRVTLKIRSIEPALNKKAGIINDDIHLDDISIDEISNDEISDKPVSDEQISEDEISNNLEEEKVPFPKIGYCRMPGNNLLTNFEIAALTKVHFDHYRVELFMSTPQWWEELQAAISEAEILNTSLELIVFFSDSFEKEISHLMQQLNKYERCINSLLPLHIDHDVTPAFLIQSLYSRFKDSLPSVKIGYGTNAYFAALNRNRPVSVNYDFVSFSLNPQVHASDTRTIIENLESQQQILESIRQFTTKPVRISPVTFQQRNKTENDPRLQSYVGVTWTLMSIKNFSKADFITLYQTAGDRGIVVNSGLANDTNSPLYEVLVQLKEFQPVYVVLNDKKDEIIFENKAGKRLTYKTQNYFS
jgi:hypothetical protein